MKKKLKRSPKQSDLGEHIDTDGTKGTKPNYTKPNQNRTRLITSSNKKKMRTYLNIKYEQKRMLSREFDTVIFGLVRYRYDLFSLCVTRDE